MTTHVVTPEILPVLPEAPPAVPAVEAHPDPHATAKDAHGAEPVRPLLSFYVYEAPVRIWHWAVVVVLTVLSITGYLIASPGPSEAGDTSALFSMGRQRELHFVFGWLLAIAALWRAYWALVGDKHARLIYFIPFWDRKWWREVMSVVRWYLFIDLRTHKWVGHNPLARASMFLMFTLGTAFMILSGFGLYGEQLGAHSWVARLFGWTLTVAGSSMALRTWHHVGMYVLVLFAIIHVYAAVRDEIMGRVSTISSMFSGWRTFRDFKD